MGQQVPKGPSHQYDLFTSLFCPLIQLKDQKRRPLPLHSVTQTTVRRLLLAEQNNSLGFRCGHYQECVSGLLHGIFPGSPFSSLLLLLMLSQCGKALGSLRSCCAGHGRSNDQRTEFASKKIRSPLYNFSYHYQKDWDGDWAFWDEFPGISHLHRHCHTLSRAPAVPASSFQV